MAKMEKQVESTIRRWIESLAEEGLHGVRLQVGEHSVTYRPREGVVFSGPVAAGEKTVITGSGETGRDEDRETWESARRIDAVNSYRKYLKQYPGGRFVREAEAAIRKLTREAPPEGLRPFTQLEKKKRNLARGILVAFVLVAVLGIAGYFIITGSGGRDPYAMDPRQNTVSGEAGELQDQPADDGIQTTEEESTGIPESPLDDSGTVSLEDQTSPVERQADPPAGEEDKNPRVQTHGEPADPAKDSPTVTGQKHRESNLEIKPDTREPKTRQIESENETTAVPEVYLITVPSAMIKAYKQEMSRRQIAGLRKQTSVSGEIRLNVSIDQKGGLSIRSFNHDRMKVTPSHRRESVLEAIRSEINGITLRPPVDKTGRPVRVKNFILTYRLGRIQDILSLYLLN